jgi:serine/threonine-protein kinase
MNAPTNDQSYGQTAAALGFVTDAQVQECLRIQDSMRQMGIDEPLGEILAKKAYLTPQQHAQVLKKLGIQTSPIPGYTLQGKIGQGGMGTVYKAVQTSVNRLVAIKILTAGATQDKTFVARFLQEAQAAAALNHKNLIAAIDVGISNGIHYFVMEYVTGKSCREILNAKGSFAEAEALSVAAQMAEVLGHIHQHRIVHRDIKPENIMLTPEGVVKLCDLGLAKSTTAMSQSLTQEGLTVGTPYFMSPEQIRGDKDVDIRADLYSLGATLYFLLTGKHPYEGKSAAETMSMHLNQAVPDPRRAAPGLSEDTALVVQKLMAKDRMQRYQTPAELGEDLKHLQAGASPHLARQHAARAHVMRTQRRTARRARSQAPLYAGIAAGAALVGVAAFLLLKPPPKETPKTVFVQVPTPAAAPAPKGPEKPKDDPKKLAEAAALFSSAEQFLRQNRPREALGELQKLRSQYAGLEHVKGRMAELGSLSGQAAAKLQAAESAQARQIQEAQAAYRSGLWSEAQTRFEELVKVGHAVYQKEADHCRREAQAEATVRDILAARDQGRWIDATTRILALQAQHKQAPLQSVEKAQAELTAALIQTRLEQDAARHLAEAHAAAVAANWKELARLLPEIEKRRETDTYRRKEGEVKALRERLAAGNDASAEEAASGSWPKVLDRVSDALGAKKWDDAETELREWQAIHSATKFVRAKEAEVNARIADLTKRKRDEREAEAVKLWNAIQKDFKNQAFDVAAEGLAKFLGEYSDTREGKQRAGASKQLKSYLDAVVKAPEYLVAELEFEDYPGSWTHRSGASGGNSTEDPHQGRRAARLTLPPDSSSRCPLLGLMNPRVEFISFFARARGSGKPAKLQAILYEESPMVTNIYGTSFPVGPEWTKFQAPLSQFKPLNPSAQQKRTLEPARVSAIVFAPEEDSSTTLEVQIDTLRLEAGRGK